MSYGIGERGSIEGMTPHDQVFPVIRNSEDFEMTLLNAPAPYEGVSFESDYDNRSGVHTYEMRLKGLLPPSLGNDFIVAFSRGFVPNELGIYRSVYVGPHLIIDPQYEGDISIAPDMWIKLDERDTPLQMEFPEGGTNVMYYSVNPLRYTKGVYNSAGLLLGKLVYYPNFPRQNIVREVSPDEPVTAVWGKLACFINRNDIFGLREEFDKRSPNYRSSASNL